MTLISWVLMLPVLPRPKSYSAFFALEHLAFSSLYCIRGRLLVRLAVRIWSGCALIWGSTHHGLEAGHLALIGPSRGDICLCPGGALFLVHTDTKRASRALSVCPACSPKAHNSQMSTGEVPFEM